MIKNHAGANHSKHQGTFALHLHILIRMFHVFMSVQTNALTDFQCRTPDHAIEHNIHYTASDSRPSCSSDAPIVTTAASQISQLTTCNADTHDPVDVWRFVEVLIRHSAFIHTSAHLLSRQVPLLIRRTTSNYLKEHEWI
ncbi:hypothetical protein BIW11_11538 [Tropilaelaps mercedesae]|uniref:Uncharacterized protein n=1 Tax=Tropilaelaps mercedesae TaxID=418985 RepID=A0A1V9XAK3_9ACAR|nr:hypothetical protein BIW11_11538 [Tropilaelaps mercedesae]